MTGQLKDFSRWSTCINCGQDFHSGVDLALGTEAWKTYVGRKENQGIRFHALELLGNAFYYTGDCKRALSVFQTCLSDTQRFNFSPGRQGYIMSARANIANALNNLSRFDEALPIFRDSYAAVLRHPRYSDGDFQACMAAFNLSIGLNNCGFYAEAEALGRKHVFAARQSLGADHDMTLNIVEPLCIAIRFNPSSSHESLREAEAMLVDALERRMRVYGAAFPHTARLADELQILRVKLRYQT